VSESCCRALGKAQTLDTDVMLASILSETSEKQGISAFRSLAFGALNFPVSHREIPVFRAASASETVPSLCSILLHHILLHHIRGKPQTSCNSLAYQNATESLQFACSLCPLHKCCVMCKAESSPTSFSFLTPRPASLQRIRDHCGATETTAHLTFRDRRMQISHSQPPRCPCWILPLDTLPNPAFPP